MMQTEPCCGHNTDSENPLPASWLFDLINPLSAQQKQEQVSALFVLKPALCRCFQAEPHANSSMHGQLLKMLVTH
jgi:hypothetical protein